MPVSLDIANMARELNEIAGLLGRWSTGLSTRLSAAARVADDLARQASALEQSVVPSAEVIDIDAFRAEARIICPELGDITRRRCAWECRAPALRKKCAHCQAADIDGQGGAS